MQNPFRRERVALKATERLYNRDGQTFLLAGQILKIFFIAGLEFLTFGLCYHILSFSMPFGLQYECTFKFLIMKKVGGQQIKVGGPHFGHKNAPPGTHKIIPTPVFKPLTYQQILKLFDLFHYVEKMRIRLR